MCWLLGDGNGRLAAKQCQNRFCRSETEVQNERRRPDPAPTKSTLQGKHFIETCETISKLPVTAITSLAGATVKSGQCTPNTRSALPKSAALLAYPLCRIPSKNAL